MPVFNYQAKDGSGQTVSGEIMASDERAAAGQIRELGYYPMRVQRGGPAAAAGMNVAVAGPPPGVTNSAANSTTVSAGAATAPAMQRPLYSHDTLANNLGTPLIQPYGSWFERTFVFPIWTGVSLTSLALFYRQFAAMLSAGMTVHRALTTLETQSDGSIRKIVAVMSRHVQAGGKLSEAMAMFPFVFRKLQRAIIEAAEISGMLDLMMQRLSDYLEAEYQLRQMIKRETFMTKIQFAATFLVPTLVIAFVNGATAYFNQAVLPLLRLLLDFGLIYVVGRYALTIRPIAIAYDTVKAYTPYFGSTVRMLALAKFARALSALYAGGVLLPYAVQTASRVTGNEYLSYSMEKAVAGMMSGQGLTESLRDTGVFPPMFVSMLGTGEATGNLDMVMGKIAEFYEAEAESRLKKSVQMLGVLLLLIMGYMVLRICIDFYAGPGYAGQFTDLMKDQ